MKPLRINHFLIKNYILFWSTLPGMEQNLISIYSAENALSAEY